MVPIFLSHRNSQGFSFCEMKRSEDLPFEESFEKGKTKVPKEVEGLTKCTRLGGLATEGLSTSMAMSSLRTKLSPRHAWT